MADQGMYFEPFLGGAAVFFNLHPERALLSDINEDLISTYRVVAQRPHELISRIKALSVSRTEYDRIRRSQPHSALSKAVRFLYLNRTAFGGLYRLNAHGSFNVPFGGGDRRPDILWNQHLIERASDCLYDADLIASDFGSIMPLAQAGDIVYCDPTYTVSHNNNSFIRYNEKNFSWSDQERLMVAAEDAVARGATVILSNADHPSVRTLYQKWFMVSISRPSCLCPGTGKETKHDRTADRLERNAKTQAVSGRSLCR